MPPRRSGRATTTAASSSTPSESTTAKPLRASRGRKQVVESPPPDEEDNHDDEPKEDGGFPGESSEEEEETVKPKPRGRAAATKKVPVKAVPKGKAASAPKRRSARAASIASSLGDEEEQVVPEDTVIPPEMKETEPDEEDEAIDTTPAARKVSSGSSKTQNKSKPAPSETDSEDEEELQSMLPKRAGTAIPPSPRVMISPAKPQIIPASEAGSDSEDLDEGDATVTLDTAPSTSTPIPSTPRAMPPGTPGTRPAQPRRSIPATPAPPPGPKPRLTIHKLVLVNFKSYAGRQEIGPFHKSFSAIVGPNGSGKSNTIDALLFVFGYRASKMRQGKLSELIHNSAGKEGLETCSVEVWFREIVDLPGVDNFLLVPNSQLVVTRTAFRNNTSKYTINDKSSSFTEVTTLLKGKGIDLDHNRFLILQGEVESIAQMKAKAQNEHEDGLLEYLEDIIGTTKYKEPIEQASLEVEALNEERGEKMNRLRVVEREKASLEDKKLEAEEFLRNSNELTRKKSLLWQFHMHTLNNNLEITSKAIESLTTQLQTEQNKNAGYLAEIDELQKGYDEQLAAAEDVKKLTSALVKDTKELEKLEVGSLEKKKHLNTKQKKIKKSITEDGHAKNEALSAIQNYTSELEANRTKVADLERKLEAEYAELEEIRDSLKDKTDEFTVQIDAKQLELEPWTAKISEKQSAIDVATSERDLLAEKATAATRALEEAQEAMKKLQGSEGGKREEYESLKKELAKAKRSLAEGEDIVKTMASQSEQMRGKVTHTRQKADEAKASLAADKSENAVLSSLNKLRDQGRIKGFHGRLGDLGVIDDKYDVAVTTACSALNNLVVDTVDQGQACIEFLRKGNVGRAFFMVLEKLPPRDLGRIETPENVPRLFDLIKPKDPKFAPAFYKGLFNTLVAEDLAQAQRIGFGKKRWRVVTLAGQLIDPSGTMSGGGNKVSRGGMSSKFTADKVAPEVVAKLERDTGVAEEEFATFQAERKRVEAEVNALRKRVPDIEIAMEKIELDVQTSGKRIAEAEKRLAEMKSQSKPDAADEKRIKTLDAEISSLQKEADKLRQKSSTISEQIKELHNKILEVGGVKLRAIQSKVSTTKGLLDLANETITKAEVGQAKAERDAEKLGKAIEKNKAAIAEVEAELEVVDGDLAAVQGDLQVIRAKVNEAQEALVDVQDALAESKAELDEKSEAINSFRTLEMDIKQKIEDNARVQKDSKDKLKHWKKRHDELELAFVDEEDEDEDEQPEAEKPEPAAAEAGEGEGEGDEQEQEPKIDKKKRKHDSTELVEYSPDELRSVDKEVLNAEISQLEEEISKAKPNLNVLAEYRKRESEFLDRAKDLEGVTNNRDTAKKRYDDLRKVRLDEFMAGFSAISAKLKEMYHMITMGGNAEIELIDSMDPFSEGVVLSIMPPKKSWRAIANLSGGEKTLASLALVFALHVFKPTPLYFMDEIDAALDFKNVSIVANYIQSKTQAAQFIVISLRNDMFELAHRLVGIYKTSNCTKSIAIDNKDLRTQALGNKGKNRSPVKRPNPEDRERDKTIPPTPATIPATPGTVVG